jgi:RNAse (barnase) inhibitor barstar
VTSAKVRLTRATSPDGAARVDGGAAHTRLGLFAELTRALRLPDYFGRNWDALVDVLRDRLAEGDLVIVVDNAAQLLIHEPPAQLGTLLAVLDDVADDDELTLLLRCAAEEEAALAARLQAASAAIN